MTRTTLQELPAAMREYCAVFMYLRALGFESDDIYVQIGAGGVIQGLLRAQGLEFRFDCGRVGPEHASNDAFAALYKTTVRTMREASNDDRALLLETTANGQDRLGLLKALARKGFRHDL